MQFNLEKLFTDVFKPTWGEIVAVICDLPHDEIADNEAWQQRRTMAREWHSEIERFSIKFGLRMNPLLVYAATGSHNSDLPRRGTANEEQVSIEEALSKSTIVIAMTEFSASAPLINLALKHPEMRVASMPGVSKSMENTALRADYSKIAEVCARLSPHFKQADGIHVIFSTGHRCYFDISNHTRVYEDNGLLPPDLDPDGDRFANLPAGEVCTCPNEAADSKTAGEIPAVVENESIVFSIAQNEIIGVAGNGPVAARLRQEFESEKALRNIAEVAIGCNDKAVVTGNVLEDEKAGFHWAYGRSDHLGGTVGISDFSSPGRVHHQDIVYASDSPIVCIRLDFVFPSGDKLLSIIDGELKL